MKCGRSESNQVSLTAISAAAAAAAFIYSYSQTARIYRATVGIAEEHTGGKACCKLEFRGRGHSKDSNGWVSVRRGWHVGEESTVAAPFSNKHTLLDMVGEREQHSGRNGCALGGGGWWGTQEIDG